MSSYEVIAEFQDAERANLAIEKTRASWVASVTDNAGDRSSREGHFMGRIVLVIVAWSIAGTAIGAAFGALLALTVGPSGTEGLIIQVVVWAVFAHLLIGMWAGYALLADRTGRDLAAVRVHPVVLRAECATIDESERLANEIRLLGATDVRLSQARSSTSYQI